MYENEESVFKREDATLNVPVSRFVPRDYQLPLFEAFEEKGFKRAVISWSRRAGKDITALNLLLRAALRKVGVYFICYPTYSQGRKILWESMTNEGIRFLDFIPPELIESTNSTMMQIRLKNQSLIQVVGSDNIDSLVGTNPIGIVFSEYALQDPSAYTFLRPALTANGGWCLFISTPRGRNSFFDLYNIAINNPDTWFCSRLTVEDTKHISLEAIEAERASGEMSEDLIAQEYYVSWSMGIEGSFYCKYIDKMKLDGRIGSVPYQAGHKVHTCADIGFTDSTAIIFFQVIGQQVNIIDYYENSKEGLPHYVRVMEQKANAGQWVYGKHFAPHDIRVTEFSSGVSRIDQARRLGITYTITRNVPIMDGIEQLRASFSKMWIDEVKCARLIKCLENYRQEWDDKKKVYKSCVFHDQFSHGADAARYLSLNIKACQIGTTPEELEQRYREARGIDEQNNYPRFDGNRF